jgi:hypothetical protein
LALSAGHAKEDPETRRNPQKVFNASVRNLKVDGATAKV